jgi:5-methylthioadenosine/S-adenosylhomocysteine deaminase
MYFHRDAGTKAAIETGMRYVHCGAVSFDNKALQLEEEFEKYNNCDPLISYRLGFHAEYTCKPDLLGDVAALSHKLSQPVFYHNSETKDETDACIKRTGMTPTQYVDSFGLHDCGGGIFHGVWLSDADMDILKKRGMYVVTNPGSNVKLASGTARVCDMQEKGIKLALGTDGAASNNCLDFFREMFLCAGLQKLYRRDASSMDALDVLRLACRDGASLMGLSDSDCLAAGKNADFVIIDMHQPNMRPIHNIAKNIVYSGSKINVKATVIAGKHVYEDGKFAFTSNPDEIYQKAQQIIEETFS